MVDVVSIFLSEAPSKSTEAFSEYFAASLKLSASSWE